METHSDYRLERWIAVLLGLLFFLPFVAQADDLLATGSFHGEDVRHIKGGDFLALVQLDGGRWMLQPVRVRMQKAFDPVVDDEGEMTGTTVEATGVDDAILIRNSGLASGPVTAASPDGATLALGTTTTIRLRGAVSTLRFRCGSVANEDGAFDCRLVLSTGESEQEIASYDAFPDANGKPELPDLAPEVIFAGDLDHDGRLDLLLDLANHYNLWRPALFLSSAADEGALVKKVAELTTSGC